LSKTSKKQHKQEERKENSNNILAHRDIKLSANNQSTLVIRTTELQFSTVVYLIVLIYCFPPEVPKKEYRSKKNSLQVVILTTFYTLNLRKNTGECSTTGKALDEKADKGIQGKASVLVQFEGDSEGHIRWTSDEHIMSILQSVWDRREHRAEVEVNRAV
jgi:hypothetical protein